MQLLTIDFEFTHAQEPFQRLVSCATGEVSGDSHTITVWWLADGSQTQALKEYLLSIKETRVLAAYSIVAEARSFLALGLDPLQFKWFDLFIAFRMLHNKVKKHDGWKYGLTGCCQEMGVSYRYLQDEKDSMVDLILSKSDYTESEREQIEDYCKADIEPLPELAKRLVIKLMQAFEKPQKMIVQALLNHSEYSAATAIVENNGMPVDLTAINNLIANHKAATDFFINRCKYKFWQDGVFKISILDALIHRLGLSSSWLKTTSGHFSCESKVLEKNSVYSPYLSSLLETKKYLSCVSRFNPEKCVLLERIGSDTRLRSHFNPMGSQTGRNQPSTRYFIFGFSSVFRVLMRPLPGFTVTEIDWSQQEFAIGAKLSGDANMIAAYNSGDPYLAFAKMANAVPADATKSSHAMLRQAFKSTVLGVQYGMGVRALSAKLTLDSGREYSLMEAERLLSFHKHTFKRYWDWLYQIDRQCYKKIPLFTRDGWGLLTEGSKETTNSRRNFLVQGTGATLLRVAIIRALRAGLKVVGSYHDSIYIEHADTDTEAPTRLHDIMRQTCLDVIDMNIATETVSHPSDKPWIAPKAVKIYPEFEQFIKGVVC